MEKQTDQTQILFLKFNRKQEKTVYHKNTASQEIEGLLIVRILIFEHPVGLNFMSNYKLYLTPIINTELFYKKATFSGVNSSPAFHKTFAIFNASYKHQGNPKIILFISAVNVTMNHISK